MVGLRASGRGACDARASRACLATAVGSCVNRCTTVCEHISGVRESLVVILGVLSVPKRVGSAWCQWFCVP